MSKIIYGYYTSSIGKMLIARSDIGVCWLSFVQHDALKDIGYRRMKSSFKDAVFKHDDSIIAVLGEKIVQAWSTGDMSDVALDLKGTAFQMSVWDRLLQIKRGETLHYGDIANDLGTPKAVRAVGTAVGRNPVSLLVPCHRVLPKAGGVGQYAWGSEVKETLLSCEGAF